MTGREVDEQIHPEPLAGIIYPGSGVIVQVQQDSVVVRQGIFVQRYFLFDLDVQVEPVRVAGYRSRYKRTAVGACAVRDGAPIFKLVVQLDLSPNGKGCEYQEGEDEVFHAEPN